MTQGRKYLTLFFIGLILLIYWPQVSGAQTLNQVALVVRHGENDVRTACVEFSEAQLSGYELLQRSGLNVAAEFQGNGALVCSIDQTGCSASNCLCQCQGGGDCTFWSYWHLENQTWVYSPGGASNYQVFPGSVEGWSWGPGNTTDAIPPPQTSFAEVCAADVTATPSPTATATATTIVLALPTTAPTTAPTNPPPTNTVTTTPLPNPTQTVIPTATAVATTFATPIPPTTIPTTAVAITTATGATPTPLPPVTQTPDSVIAATSAATQTPAIMANERIVLPSGQENSAPTGATAVAPLPPTQPAANIIAAAETPQPPQILRVVGAGAVPTQAVPSATAVAANNTENAPTLFPYLIFIVIITLLLSALALVNRRHKPS